MKKIIKVYRLLLATLYFIPFGYAHAANYESPLCDPPTIMTQPFNDTLCNGTSVYYYVAANGTDLSFDWQINRGSGFVDLDIEGIYSTDYIPQGEGAASFLYIDTAADSISGYQYRCIITSDCSISDTSDAVTLTTNLPHFIMQPVDATVCVLYDTSFIVTLDTSSGVTYQWQVDQGSGFSNVSNGGIYSGATSDTLKLTGVTSSLNGYQYKCVLTGACSPSSDIVTLTVIYAPPSIESQPIDDTVCYGTVTYFSLYTGDADAAYYTFDWQVNTGSGFEDISYGDNYSQFSFFGNSYLEIGSATSSMNGYQYRCIIIGLCSFYDTSNVATLKVNSPTVTASASPTSICYNANTTLTAGGVVSYTWYPTTGLNADTGTSVIATLTATTSYTVTGTDTNGCTNTATVSININPQIFANTGGSKSICLGGADTLGGHPSASGGISPYAYSWFNEGADSVFSTSTNPIVTVSYPNLYSLTVTDSVGCTVTNGVIITLFTVNAGISDTILSGTNDTLGGKPVNNGGYPPFTYSWSSNPSGFTSSVANPVINPTVTTTYYLNVADSTGCTANDSVTISVLTIDTIITLSTPDTSIQNYTSISFTDTVQWYKFTADSGTVVFTIPNDSASTNITRLSVFCVACPGFSVISSTNKIAGRATSLSVIEEGLNPGQLYYIAVSQPYGNNSNYTLEYDNQNSNIDTSCSWTNTYPLNSTNLPFDKTGWAVIFDDEFSQDASLRRDYWNKVDYRTYWLGSSFTQSDSTDIELVNGHLRLLQKKIASPANYIRVNSNLLDSATNGEISTRRPDASLTVSFLPNVYVESKLWLNFQGTYMTDPAVFLWNGYGYCTSPGISNYSEIDNFEFGNPYWFNRFLQHQLALLTLHWPSACRCGSSNGNGEGDWYNIPNTISDIRDTFHTWGMLYTPNTVAWYLDSMNIKTDTDRAHIYQQPMILDIWDFIPYNNTEPIIPYSKMNHNWMDLDYVKVYTDSVPVMLIPDTICADAAVEYKTYAYPGVYYDWSGGDRCCDLLFSSSESGTYKTGFNGSAVNDGHDVWIKPYPGLGTNTTYSLVVTLNGLDGNTITKTINVFVDSIPNVTVTAPVTMPSEYPGVVYACICYSPTLTASGANSYRWSPSNSLSASTGSSVMASPTSSTTYTVTGNGCASTAPAAATIAVSSTCNTIGGVEFCFDCDWCHPELLKEKLNNDTTITALSASDYLKIYPNPNSGSFTLQIYTDSSVTNIKVQLFNILGQLVYEQNAIVINGYLQEQVQPIGIANGIYLVRVNAGKLLYKQLIVINKNI